VTQAVEGLSDEQLASYPTVYRADLFAGQRVLITGGGSGLGKAMAWLYGRLGAKVVVCARQADKLETAALPMRAAGIDVETALCNIRDPAAVEALFAGPIAQGGGIDILINNAGGQFPQSAIDFSAKGWHAVVDTNLNGTWAMMQSAARVWRDAKRSGSIVNIVTVVDRGMPGVAHTCAARAGVIGLVKSVAVEWCALGIRVNCVAPGAIATEGMRVYSDEARTSYLRSNPMLRFGDAMDIAEASVYLAGPSGKFITGEVLTVDGGGRYWGEFWAIPRPDYFAP